MRILLMFGKRFCPFLFIGFCIGLLLGCSDNAFQRSSQGQLNSSSQGTDAGPGPVPEVLNPPSTSFSVMNTKACFFGAGGSMTNSIYEVNSKSKRTQASLLLWRVAERKGGKLLHCGQITPDADGRFKAVEKSKMTLSIPKEIADFDPSDYTLDILEDSDGDGTCSDKDKIVGSSASMPRGNFGDGPFMSSADDNDLSFVLTTSLLTAALDIDDDNCDSVEPRSPDCECDELEEPLVIDFGGDGYQLTSASGGVQFDIDNSGRLKQVAWTATSGNDAFVARDLNGNNRIDGGHELFGTATVNPNGSLAANGFEALISRDNGDMTLNANDEVYSQLLLWFDRNKNGISEPGELEALSSRISSLKLKYKVSDKEDSHGNRIYAESTATLLNGDAVSAADVWLTLAK